MKVPKTNNKLIYVLSATGSAVGMANVWGFPYKFHKSGILFLIFYLIFISIFSYVGLSSEFAIGRLSQKSIVGSYEYAIRTRFKNSKLASFIGYIPLVISIIIAVGYTIIVSYVAKAMIDTLNGTLLNVDAGVWFDSVSSTSFSVLEMHLAIIVITILISLGGFKSIQTVNGILMPLMIVIYIVVLIKLLTIPGIIEGYKFLFRFDINKLNIATIIAALGDALFALSITGFGMILVGKMMPRSQDIVHTARLTAIFDTIVALMSAFIIVPSMVVYAMQQYKGSGLIFYVLPTIFRNMAMGRGFGVLFYLAIILAGLTSLQNQFESIANTLVIRFKFSNNKALVLIGLVVFGLGISLHPIARWEPLMDTILYYLIPLGAIIGSITWFFVMDKDILLREINKGAKKKHTDIFIKFGRYIYTPMIIIICLASIFLPH